MGQKLHLRGPGPVFSAVPPKRTFRKRILVIAVTARTLEPSYFLNRRIGTTCTEGFRSTVSSIGELSPGGPGLFL